MVYIKGTVQRFHMQVHGSVSSLLQVFINFYHPCGRYGRFYGVMARSIHALPLLVGQFGPHRYTIKSFVTATGLEKI